VIVSNLRVVVSLKEIVMNTSATNDSGIIDFLNIFDRNSGMDLCL